MNPPVKPSIFVSILSWLSVFSASWLILLRRLPSDWISWSFFAFFLIVAVFSSALSSKGNVR